MNRREVLVAIAALPFMGWLAKASIGKAKSKGAVAFGFQPTDWEIREDGTIVVNEARFIGVFPGGSQSTPEEAREIIDHVELRDDQLLVYVKGFKFT